jgi:hypothetical protein
MKRLTPRNRVLEKLIVIQLVKKFPACDSSVGIALDNQGSRVRFPAGL